MYGHDWQCRYDSVEKAEEDLPGFKFQGNGWYISKTDTLYANLDPFFNTLQVFVWNTSCGREIYFTLALQAMTDLRDEITQFRSQPVFQVK